jgi:hypothetical protein
MEIILNSYCIPIIAILYGIQLIYQGRRMSTKVEPVLFPIERISLWLLGALAGEEAAVKRRSELLQTDRIRRMGLYAQVVGFSFILVGIIVLLGLLGMLRRFF